MTSGPGLSRVRMHNALTTSQLNLTPPRTQGGANDNLGLLVTYICLERDLLPQLFASLSSGNGADALGLDRPTAAQVALVHELCSEAHAAPCW